MVSNDYFQFESTPNEEDRGFGELSSQVKKRMLNANNSMFGHKMLS
jgi:hypothetical protein